MGKRYLSLRVVILVLFLCIDGWSKDFWLEKPFAKWNKKEAEKILNDSPWADSVTFSEPAPVISSVTPRTATLGDTGGRIDVYRIFRVRFLSARPVRVALGRMTRIMKEGDRTEGIDPGAQQFIDASFGDRIVLALETESNSQRAGGELARLLSSLTLARVQPDTYLQSPSGKKNYLSDYVPPSPDGLGAKLVFSRTVDGTPFISGEEGTIRFVAKFSDRYKMSVQFKLEKMLFDGKLEY